MTCLYRCALLLTTIVFASAVSYGQRTMAPDPYEPWVAGEAYLDIRRDGTTQIEGDVKNPDYPGWHPVVYYAHSLTRQIIEIQGAGNYPGEMQHVPIVVLIPFSSSMDELVVEMENFEDPGRVLGITLAFMQRKSTGEWVERVRMSSGDAHLSRLSIVDHSLDLSSTVAGEESDFWYQLGFPVHILEFVYESVSYYMKGPDGRFVTFEWAQGPAKDRSGIIRTMPKESLREGKMIMLDASDVPLQELPEMRISTLDGRLVSTVMPGADRTYQWDGRDSEGRRMPPNLYQFELPGVDLPGNRGIVFRR